MLLERLRAFVSKEAVLIVAIAAAALSCAVVPVDEAYASYVDWHTLALLFCLMAVVTGLRFLGVMRLAGQWVVSHASSARALALLLVMLAFFSSMAVTNDVALITFVPLALVMLSEARLERFAAPVVVLMTIAANLGSMLLPVGNPQNLFLYQASGMNFSQFAALMAPASLLSFALLAASVLWMFRGGSTGESKRQSFRLPGKPPVSGICLLAGYFTLFVLCVLAVAGLVDAFSLAFAMVVLMLMFDRRALLKVDYGLLLTFVALFVFVGNIARIPAVSDFLSAAVGSVPFYAAVCSSQLISNVPAAVLLSGFTDNWASLIVGANIGGLGTPIASMASLISLKIATASGMVGKASYLATFTAWNVGFLVVLCVANALFGWA